jgi:endonuclease/exonuclease/phosphatase family metal-dependent hydrolase
MRFWIARSAPAAVFRASFARLAIIALVLGCAARTTDPRAPAALDVMTFNIRYGTARENDARDEWSDRAPRVRAVVAEFDPDVLGIQEALRFQIDSLRSWFPDHEETGVGRDDGREAGEYSAILYREGRLELLDGSTEWLSETPAEPGSKSWGNEIPRIVTWARFRDRSNGRTFYVYNTHWDHQSQPSRERSAAYLLERIRAREHRSDPVIVSGDFNAGEDNPAFQALLAGDGAVQLVDTYRAVRTDTSNVGTFNAFTGATDGAKIDAILATPDWVIRDAAIVRTQIDGRYPSDHFPVIARLSIR